MAQKVYSFQEVEKHNKKDDCWIIIRGKVYNVTSFLEDHPGGHGNLLMATGKDATDEFVSLPHSYVAEEKMPQFYIGEIDPSTFPKLIRSPKVEVSESNDSVYFSSKSLLKFLPLLVLGVAILLFFSLKKE